MTVDDGAELDQHDAKKAKDLDDAGIAPTHKIDDLSTTVVAGALVRSVSRPSPYTARAPPSVTGLRLVSYQQLKLRGIPYSRSHLRRLEGTGQFPKHVTLGEGLGALIAWPEHEVDGWIAEKMARRVSGEDELRAAARLNGLKTAKANKVREKKAAPPVLNPTPPRYGDGFEGLRRAARERKARELSKSVTTIPPTRKK